MDAQRKVTCFVTRGTGEAAQTLVFWHAGGGVQVPAGTVEAGEAYAEAARREVAEETGRTDLELVRHLGVRTKRAADGEAWVLGRVRLRTRPRDDAPLTSWPLQHVRVQVRDRLDGYARVVFEEPDLDAPPDDPLVCARFEGWVPEEALTDRQERAFFQFRADEGGPDTWVQHDEGHEFQLRWEPLTPLPRVLVEGQQAWLEEFRAELVEAAPDGSRG